MNVLGLHFPESYGSCVCVCVCTAMTRVCMSVAVCTRLWGEDTWAALVPSLSARQPLCQQQGLQSLSAKTVRAHCPHSTGQMSCKANLGLSLRPREQE